MGAMSIPKSVSYEWNILTTSDGFLLQIKINEIYESVGVYGSEKEALEVLKKIEPNIVKGVNYDPYIKTRYSKSLYFIWGVCGFLNEWADILGVNVSSIRSRAIRHQRGIEKEIKVRFLDIIDQLERKASGYSRKLYCYDVWTKFIFEYKGGKDIVPPIGPFKLNAPLSFWLDYIGESRDRANKNAKDIGVTLEVYVDKKVKKMLSSKRNKHLSYVSSYDLYVYCEDARNRLKEYPGRGMVDVVIQHDRAILKNNSILIF